MDAPELIDASIGDRVIVFGSLPPAGRDIDVVGHPEQLGAIDRGLRAEGFTAMGVSLVRFRDCSVEAVDLVPISSWGLPSEASRELFRTAIPLEGRTHLCRPAPVHAILIAARRLLRERAADTGKAARNFASALAEQPDAIEAALDRSAAWGVAPAVGALRSGRLSLDRLPRARGLYAEGRRRGRSPVGSIGAVARHGGPRPRRGALVAFSGLDGSGKSTQATALASTLCRLGFDARVDWVAVANPPWLSRILSVLKRLLKAPATRRGRAGATPQTELIERNQVLARWGPEPVRDAVLSDPRLTMIWSTAVALRVGLHTGVILRSEMWRGRVVVCDRYVLDAWTYMRYHFPAAPTLRPQVALIELLSPRPLRAYLLIVDPETATNRKPDFDRVENARRMTYYEEFIDRLGVERIDGELPEGEICARIASEVCGALARR